MTWLEDFKKNPLNANPYLVMTCFDELLRKKQRALLRGDIISHMTKEEGSVVMSQFLDSYLIDHEYEKVRKFNDEPNSFDFEEYTRDRIANFRHK